MNPGLRRDISEQSLQAVSQVTLCPAFTVAMSVLQTEGRLQDTEPYSLVSSGGCGTYMPVWKQEE